MPYLIRKHDGCYSVVNKDTGRVHSKCTSKEKAQSQMRLLHGIDHGWKPSGSSRKSRKSGKYCNHCKVIHSRKSRLSRKSGKYIDIDFTRINSNVNSNVAHLWNRDSKNKDSKYFFGFDDETKPTTKLTIVVPDLASLIVLASFIVKENKKKILN